ncbi:hypothetical protein [Actinomadura gamaensis]|uniref:Uncharacterized protein n=1 Tax=Actinomadura gamaensis TaxID=1763541 RepID=A0ABV9UAK8_9ACTN
MVATEIDVAALQSELRAISGWMGEICRATGPQVWLGGGAAAFTTDLAGHVRSLDRMMSRLLDQVAAYNHIPMVTAPPPMPRVAPASGPPGVASASPTGMGRLEAALNRTSDGLPAAASRIRRVFALGCPHDPDVGQCARTAAWCKSEAERMRTRIHYALAENRANPALLLQGPMVPVPDRFGPREMADLGRMQAIAFGGETLSTGPGPSGLLTDIGQSLREHANDPDYLAAFFGRVPSGSIGKLAHALYERHEGTPLTTADKAVLGDIGTALGALSRRQREPVDQALGPIGSDMPGQALLVRLSAPNVKWSSAVLLDMARVSLRWRQDHPSYNVPTRTRPDNIPDPNQTVGSAKPLWWTAWGLNGPDDRALATHDPALSVLGRIASQNDTAAARALLATRLETTFTIKDAAKADPLTWLHRGYGDTYASLLVTPDWHDGGTAAGDVIRLGTTPEKGHDEEAARNTADLIRAVAWWNDNGREKLSALLKNAPLIPGWLDTTGLPAWIPHDRHYPAGLGPGLRTGLLNTTRANLAVLAYADRTTSGTGMLATDPISGRPYVNVNGSDVQSFLRTLAADDRTWAKLAVAAQSYRQQAFAWGLRTGMIEDAADRVGFLDGNLIPAYVKERTNSENLTKAEADSAKEVLGALRSLVLGKIPLDETPGASDAMTALTDKMLSKLEYSDFEKKIAQIKARGSAYSDQIYLDLALGYSRAHGGRIGDATVDSLLRKASLTDDEQQTIIQWSRTHVFSFPSSPDHLPLTGSRIIRTAEEAVEHEQPAE